jgi:urocanate hydratase
MPRPMYMEFRPKRPIRAQTGTRLQCRNWDAEAALRMLRNNLDPDVALDWKELIIYGGQGRAARNWQEYHRIVRALKSLTDEQTSVFSRARRSMLLPPIRKRPGL